MSSYNVSEKYSAIRAEYLGTCNGVYMFRFGKMCVLEWNKRWRCIHSG